MVRSIAGLKTGLQFPTTVFKTTLCTYVLVSGGGGDTMKLLGEFTFLRLLF